MQINIMPGCCSMVVIQNNPDVTDKNYFFTTLKDLFLAKQIRYKDIKVIVLVTNWSWFNRLKYYKLGFRRKFSYKGNHHKKAHVMFLKLKKNWFYNY